jgi:hypothetical protein
MDDPVLSTKKRGWPKGRNRLVVVIERTYSSLLESASALSATKKQAEVVAESNKNYDELSSSGVAAEVETPSIVEDESDSEIEHGDEDEDEDVNARDADHFV